MKTTWMALAVSGVLALSACNTAEGVGRDMSHTGQWISDKASGRDKDPTGQEELAE